MTRLERTIIHWEEQLANARADRLLQITSPHCPLCNYYSDGSGGCTNTEDETCPISLETGKPNCDGSPWRTVQYSLKFALGQPGPGTIPAVKAELAFLKSLPDPETET